MQPAQPAPRSGRRRRLLRGACRARCLWRGSARGCKVEGARCRPGPAPAARCRPGPAPLARLGPRLRGGPAQGKPARPPARPSARRPQAPSRPGVGEGCRAGPGPARCRVARVRALGGVQWRAWRAVARCRVARVRTLPRGHPPLHSEEQNAIAQTLRQIPHLDKAPNAPTNRTARVRTRPRGHPPDGGGGRAGFPRAGPAGHGTAYLEAGPRLGPAGPSKLRVKRAGPSPGRASDRLGPQKGWAQPS
jgi:hypothetical protein